MSRTFPHVIKYQKHNREGRATSHMERRIYLSLARWLQCFISKVTLLGGFHGTPVPAHPCIHLGLPGNGVVWTLRLLMHSGDFPVFATPAR